MTFPQSEHPIINCKDVTFAAYPPFNNPLGGCEATVRLEANAANSSSCQGNDELTWQVYLDLWSDGTVDRLGSSQLDAAWIDQWIKVERFDDGKETQAWVLLQTSFPDVTLEDVLYVTYIAPTSSPDATVKLPEFTQPGYLDKHIATWKITDSCGNSDQCSQIINVRDTKAPTPYCVNISSAILQSDPNKAELWAKDFNFGSFDNCTPKENLMFTFDELFPVDSILHKIHYYKKVSGKSTIATEQEFTEGNAYKWDPTLKSAAYKFLNPKPGKNVFRVSVWDEARNTDFCETELIFDDFFEFSKISGQIKTTDGKALKDVEVTNEAILIEFPKLTTTDEKGNYKFVDLPHSIDYIIHADSDDDPRNGVSTLDLVYIQRHILDLESFIDPLQIIASDATDDGRVTASDLSEIRKLVLGITTKMINNSWRFPIRNQNFDMNNPLFYIEKYELKNVQADVYDIDFIAVKIGDINNTVVIDLQGDNSETRTSKNWHWSISDQTYKVGDIVSVPVYSTEDMDIYGCQLTMNTKGLRFLDAESGLLQLDESNIGIIDFDNLTMSLALANPLTVDKDTRLFTLHFIAEDNSSLHNTLNITSDITPIEYYNSQLQTGKIGLRIRHNDVQDKVVLYQNEPNPFSSSTIIPYFLPESGDVTITIYDMTGRKIQNFEVSGTKGHNTFTIDKDQIGASVAVYYTFMYKDFVETKKMMLVE